MITGLVWFSELAGAAAGLFAVAVIVILAVLWHRREGRNGALEDMVARSEYGALDKFHGTLSMAEHQPGIYLRLWKYTPANRRVQFYYRWIVGKGQQAVFDEVIFDGLRQVVELRRKDKQKDVAFAEFAALRMREVATGRGGSLWHIELLPRKGRAIPFVTSVISDRRTTFENTAVLAKAVSAILAVPVQVRVAGNVWTPGWPPKAAAISSKS